MATRCLVAAQVSRVVRHARPEFALREDWRESVARGDVILAEAGVEVVEYAPPVGERMFFDGRFIEV